MNAIDRIREKVFAGLRERQDYNLLMLGPEETEALRVYTKRLGLFVSEAGRKRLQNTYMGMRVVRVSTPGIWLQ